MVAEEIPLAANENQPSCKGCGMEIPDRRQRRKALFCSNRCRADYDRRVYYRTNRRSEEIAPGTVGAASELLASNRLMMAGFETFRALSPCCSCDLIVLHEGEPIRIEVRSGVIHGNGSRYFGKKAIDAGRHDVLMVVYANDEIEIEYASPGLEHLFDGLQTYHRVPHEEKMAEKAIIPVQEALYEAA